MNHREEARRATPQSGFDRFCNEKNLNQEEEDAFVDYIVKRSNLPIYMIAGSELQYYYKQWRKE